MLNMTEGDTIVKRDWQIIEKGVCHRIQMTILLLIIKTKKNFIFC